MENERRQKSRVVTLPEAGFCYGVKRAVRKAYEAAFSEREPVYTLGEIVHNPVVVRTLAEQGIRAAEDPSDVPAGATVIIRSHGVEPHIIEGFTARGIEVIDATCPWVKRVQNAAEDFRNRGWPIVEVGRKDHPEVRGVLAHSGAGAEVVRSAREAAGLPHKERRVVLFQTTFSPQLVDDIVNQLKSRTGILRVRRDTLCQVVSGRREAVSEMVKDVDVLVVVGGKNSSNTSSLAVVGREAGIPTFHVETVKDLKEERIPKYDSIGVVGGTSTPGRSIEQVREYLSESRGDTGSDG